MTSSITEPSLDDLRRVLRYEPDTGLFFWRITSGRAKAGNEAGCLGPYGYINICYRGKFYKAHRLAFLFMTGGAPVQVDHRNLNRSDNRWANLRAATPAQNSANTPPKGRRKKGVVAHHSRFRAFIMAEGKSHYLGTFETEANAHEAYCAAAVKLHGEFARFE